MQLTDLGLSHVELEAVTLEETTNNCKTMQILPEPHEGSYSEESTNHGKTIQAHLGYAYSLAFHSHSPLYM